MSVFGVFSSTHFPAFGLNTEIYSVNLRIQSKCGKKRIKKTPHTDLFLSSNSTCYKDFLGFKLASSFLTQSTLSPRSDLNSVARSSCNHISEAKSHLECRLKLTACISTLQITLSRR